MKLLLVYKNKIIDTLVHVKSVEVKHNDLIIGFTNYKHTFAYVKLSDLTTFKVF